MTSVKNRMPSEADLTFTDAVEGEGTRMKFLVSRSASVAELRRPSEKGRRNLYHRSLVEKVDEWSKRKLALVTSKGPGVRGFVARRQQLAPPLSWEARIDTHTNRAAIRRSPPQNQWSDSFPSPWSGQPEGPSFPEQLHS